MIESSPVSPPTLQPVNPVRPVAPYLGGKRNLSRRLVAMIAATPHDLYAEPFVGMGGIFFRRDRRPPVEVINDISQDVTNLFRILQRHYQPFLDTLKWQIAGRAEFDRLRRADPTTLTDLERAARFLYLQRLAFGGKIVGRNFGVTRTGPARFDLTKLVPMLEDVHDRLCGVHIECLGYRDLIVRYDRPGALFYLDPPYANGERDYGDGVFSPDDFAALADQLATIKGRFILSINDTPMIRETFARFSIEEVWTTYTLAGANNAKSVPELIVSGPRA